ncbi:MULTISPECIES: response regulator transcription factor [unclassified Massilia]|uniref:response regulator transcription factor n=1 Tax=unclassified Massilia TaxID=2609279 RepID=UPI001B83CA75|nr:MULTISPECIES: response regulator transcription factor [unclassified Massilia]MBQ5938627.1 response regulator transcription factor [Massilia sp. AB1]MBQ5964617.1 response regulator transcription factor [Massilia sp. ZL223]
MYRVMLVEDDARLAELVTEYLSGYEFSVDLVTRGDAALGRFKELSPDVVVLDLMLPGLDGMVVCRQIRELSEVPILILTAREDSYDEVSGLEQGADDFVNKPVQPRVLLARLRALMRRTQAKSGGDTRVLQFGALRIATSDRSVIWRGQPCVLSNTEYKLLLVLAEAAGRVLSRDALLKKMRGIEFDGLDRSIDNCISKLRRKFDDVDSEKIKTVWGEGYLFSPSAWN